MTDSWSDLDPYGWLFEGDDNWGPVVTESFSDHDSDDSNSLVRDNRTNNCYYDDDFIDDDFILNIPAFDHKKLIQRRRALRQTEAELEDVAAMKMATRYGVGSQLLGEETQSLKKKRKAEDETVDTDELAAAQTLMHIREMATYRNAKDQHLRKETQAQNNKREVEHEFDNLAMMKTLKHSQEILSQYEAENQLLREEQCYHLELIEGYAQSTFLKGDSDQPTIHSTRGGVATPEAGDTKFLRFPSSGIDETTPKASGPATTNYCPPATSDGALRNISTHKRRRVVPFLANIAWPADREKFNAVPEVAACSASAAGLAVPNHIDNFPATETRKVNTTPPVASNTTSTIEVMFPARAIPTTFTRKPPLKARTIISFPSADDVLPPPALRPPNAVLAAGTRAANTVLKAAGLGGSLIGCKELPLIAITIGLQDNEAGRKKWKTLKNKIPWWLSLIQRDWERVPVLGINTIGALGHRIMVELDNTVIGEVQLRELVTYMKNRRIKSLAKKAELRKASVTEGKA